MGRMELRTPIFSKFRRLLMLEIKTLKLAPGTKESGSLIELMELPRTQSLMSKLGFALERAFRKLLTRVHGITPLHSSNDVAQFGHQIDLLFRYKHVVYYFELKSNLNLDTEKSIAVKDKLQKMRRQLQRKYPKSKVISAALSARYACNRDVACMKPPLCKTDIYGYADFFRIFQTEVTERRWKSMFKTIGTHFQASC